MLNRLTIHNYALIDNLDIAFDPHLNIITGETGAGKSIILGALGLILGNRVENRYFYDPGKKCIIEGYFRISEYNLKSFFEQNDLDYEVETIVRREITPDSRSRAFINDTPVTLAVLKSFGARLIDIHSQHATLQINQESFQRNVLDSVADNEELLKHYQSEFKSLKELQDQKAEVQAQIEKAQSEFDYFQFLFNELEEAQLNEGEDKVLEEEQKVLENAGLILSNIQNSISLLEGDHVNVIELLKEVLNNLQKVSSFVPQATELIGRLDSVLIEVKDLSYELSGIEQNTHIDENRLDFVNDRISLLYTLLQKHRAENVDELMKLQNEIGEKLTKSDELQLELEKIDRHIEEYSVKCQSLSGELSARRHQAVPAIRTYIEDNLSKLGMPNAQFSIDVTSLNELNNFGRDSIRFLFSANKGQEMIPVQSAASGGELSRIMLVVKSLMAKSSSLPTIIFDEIDTGISGEVALSVAYQIDELSANMQVIAISHLPQIASRGHSHFKVFKEDLSEKTTTKITLLDQQERIVEIAEMLSGQNPGEAALKHAEELING